MTLGEIIKVERKKKNLTQKQLASFCGASHTSICEWERGSHHPNSTALMALATVFGEQFLLSAKEAKRRERKNER